MTDPGADEDATKQFVKQHWDGRAAMFDAESQHGIHSEAQGERWFSVLDDWTDDDPQRTLDLGCGTGVLTLLLADLGHDVTGLDFAPSMLERARAKAQRTDHAISFCRGDAETLPVSDDAVELVTARHLVWTLPDPEAALAKWHRVLEPGGRLILVEGHWDHDEPWDEYAAIHEDLPSFDGQPPGEMHDALTAAGFEAVESEPLMDPVLWGREPQHEYYLATGVATR